jgi:hypothetical protein
MFCHISFLQRFVACGTRIKTYWWQQPHPSLLFLLAVLLSHVFTFLFAGFGVLSSPLPVGTLFGLFGVALGLALLIDFVKVALYRVRWVSICTALLPMHTQRRKMADKKEKSRRQIIRRVAVNKLWKAARAESAARHLAQLGGKDWEETSAKETGQGRNALSTIEGTQTHIDMMD